MNDYFGLEFRKLYSETNVQMIDPDHKLKLINILTQIIAYIIMN